MGKQRKQNPLSDRIGVALELSGIKQVELARAIGISRVSIHNIVCGNSNTTAHTAKIAEALDINYEWLVSGEGNMWKNDRSPLKEIIAILRNEGLPNNIRIDIAIRKLITLAGYNLSANTDP